MLSYHTTPEEIGLDEAGRGPFLGRVYAGAVQWRVDSNVPIPDIITDSKKLSSSQRKRAYEWILANVSTWGIGWAEAWEIDELNILQATRLSMQRALQDLRTKCPETESSSHLIIDGVNWQKQFGDDYKVSSIVGGDGKYLSIAAASILAKESHDQHIHELCITHPEWNERYDLESNKGYGTAKHRQGIATFGICEQHRKSFKSCQNI